jgi:citrate lyase subunit alpha / citrate CoA-transferase
MINDAGREIPDRIEGFDSVHPFRIKKRYAIRENRTVTNHNKTTRFANSIEDAIGRSGLQNGDRISFHHHLRLGDRVVGQVLEALEKMGFRDLIICLSSVMGPASESVRKAVESHLIRRIETTGLKSPLSEFLLNNQIPEPVIFRSHGGRASAINDGKISIKLAFIAASASDKTGNLSGAEGPNQFGSLGYAMVDAQNASYVLGLTDYISEIPLRHISIPFREVDEIVLLDSIGEKKGISGGSLRISNRPVEKLIARMAFEVLVSANIIKTGFAYQTGSGGISLLVTRFLKKYMKEKKVKGSFASGGITADLTTMLKEGLFNTLWDVQSFDNTAVESLQDNPFHREMSASRYASPTFKDCIAEKLDVMILSATEIDRNFHVNSLTGTNGRILGALGGAPDTAAGSKLTIVVMPSFRGRIPTVCNRVNTVCTPGNTIDVLVTERGIAVNPLRNDLIEKLSGGNLPLISIDDLIAKVHNITGIPEIAKEKSRISGIIEYRDGSIIDCIRS